MYILIYILSFLSISFAEEDWQLVSVKDGITSTRKNIVDSPLFAFRGEADVPDSLGALSAVLLKDDIGPEWVDLMNLSKSLRIEGPYSKVIHQGYDLPWPIQDRDYLMREVANYNQETKVFTLMFESIEDPILPKQSCCIRAKTYRTFWRLSVNPDNTTHVEVEVYTDPKGSLPAWLINLIQKDWPYNTISGLLKRSRVGDIQKSPEATDWN